MRANPVFFFIVPLLCCTLFGCHAAPLTYSDAQLQSPEARAEVANLYWRPINAPDLHQPESRRVALVDFTVEFITGKVEMPGAAQPTFTAPAIAPAHIGFEYSGVYRQQYTFDEQLCRDVTAELYRIFIDTLNERGFEILPNETVCAAAAYQRLVTKERDDGSLMYEMNIVGSDTGRIKQMTALPADGLRIVVGAKEGNVEAVEQALLEELDADVSLRAHIRVGVYQGRASVDRGSMICSITRGGSSNLTAEKSLLSDKITATPAEFVAFQGQTFSINAEEYLAAMRIMFPPYADMAFSAK